MRRRLRRLRRQVAEAKTPTTTTRRQQQQQQRDADGDNLAMIDKILTYFTVLSFRKISTKNEVLKYLIKVFLFLIISKNVEFGNLKKQIQYL